MRHFVTVLVRFGNIWMWQPRQQDCRRTHTQANLAKMTGSGTFFTQTNLPVQLYSELSKRPIIKQAAMNSSQLHPLQTDKVIHIHDVDTKLEHISKSSSVMQPTWPEIQVIADNTNTTDSRKTPICCIDCVHWFKSKCRHLIQRHLDDFNKRQMFVSENSTISRPLLQSY